MSRRTATLLLIAAIAVAGVLAYVVSEVRVAAVRTERAIVEMDGWLRLASKLDGQQGHQSARDLIDLNLDGALAMVILNSGHSMLDDDTERQLHEHLVLLQKYWAANPPYEGPQWSTLQASPVWRDSLASKMAFLNSYVTQRRKQ